MFTFFTLNSVFTLKNDDERATFGKSPIFAAMHGGGETFKRLSRSPVNEIIYPCYHWFLQEKKETSAGIRNFV